jgi:nucleotide-binding universal stress UspA family protein
MTLSLLLPLLTYPTPTPPEGLGYAVGLAATLGGRLTVIAHDVDIPPITNPLAAGFYDYATISATVEADSKRKASELITLAQRLGAQLQLPVTEGAFRSRAELAANHLAGIARTFDLALAVVDRRSNTHRDAAEVLLFESGGPVLLVPGAGRASLLEKIAVAWDGGRAAARAVRDALPLLRMGRHAVLLTASEDKLIKQEGIEAITALLASHEISVAHRDVDTAGRPIGDVLQEAALANGAGLLVMGAYGQPRLREFVLGGATRTVLADLKLPVFMSH